MPIHDWTRVPAGLFHHFHQDWSTEITRILNRGGLPKGLSALIEQRVGHSESGLYPEMANRIVVRRHLGRIIAVIEIVSPGNKDGRADLKDFVMEITDLLHRGVHVLVVDLFPPTPGDPVGIHKAIWDEIEEKTFVLPAGKDRILASYQSGDAWMACVEPVNIGSSLPDMPLFLANERYVKVALEESYQAAWDASPEQLRVAVVTGTTPEGDPD